MSQEENWSRRKVSFHVFSVTFEFASSYQNDLFSFFFIRRIFDEVCMSVACAFVLPASLTQLPGMSRGVRERVCAHAIVFI